MKIAIMGCGTVGTGVYEIIKDDAAALTRGARGEKTEVKYILDIRAFSDPEKEAIRVSDIDLIAGDPEIGLVVESMGGLHPAFEFCMKCLRAGKSVVTSNKLLVAAKAEELFAAAKESGAAFRFGAAVCGGIPVIRTLFYGLAANRIDGFCGILNGTSNFILTKMIRENMSNAAALGLAQEYGYAEKDPTDDIGGADACRKTAILVSVCFGRHIYPEEILTEGITGISGEDVEYARAMGCRIKLLGRARRTEGGKIYACVSPAVLKESDLIANVDGVFNALKVRGSRVGEVMLYGPGAGKDATASAVVADILDCVRTPGFDAAYSWENGTKNDLIPCGEYETALYVRGCANDKNGLLSALRAFPGGAKVLSRPGAPENEAAFVTGVMKEDLLRAAVDALPGFTAQSVIRVWDD
jgi:homoserine dehydrogenase